MKQTFIGKGLKGLVKGSPNLNVLNILRTLIEDGTCECYIPFEYSTEKKTSKDPRIHFMPIESGKKIKVTTIQSNKERFNFSITGEVDVYVEYEGDDGSIELLPKKIFRTYTVIRDSKLTIDYIIAKLSEETFNELRNANVLYYNGVEVAKHHKYVPDFLYKIKLTDIPLVSYAWAQPQQIGLYANLNEENVLSNTLTEVNKIIKDFQANGQIVPSENENSIYYNEPYLGEERNGCKVECECVTYEVKNEKTIDQDYIDIANQDIASAVRVKKTITKLLKDLRFVDRCIVMAIELSSTKGNFNWSEPKITGRTILTENRTTEVPGLGRMYELTRKSYKKMF